MSSIMRARETAPYYALTPFQALYDDLSCLRSHFHRLPPCVHPALHMSAPTKTHTKTQLPSQSCTHQDGCHTRLSRPSISSQGYSATSHYFVVLVSDPHNCTGAVPPLLYTSHAPPLRTSIIQYHKPNTPAHQQGGPSCAVLHPIGTLAVLSLCLAEAR